MLFVILHFFFFMGSDTPKFLHTTKSKTLHFHQILLSLTYTTKPQKKNTSQTEKKGKRRKQTVVILLDHNRNFSEEQKKITTISEN